MSRKIYGYCRISKAKQSIERQIRNIIKAYPEAVIIEEAFTGTKIDRPKFNNLLKRVKHGDLIIFDSVSRMSRNSSEGFELYEDLYNRGVELVFLKESYINTAIYKKQLETSESISLDGKGVVIQETEKFIRNILMGLAKEQIIIAFEQSEKEVMDLRQRTREGLKTAKEKGMQVGRKKGDTLVVKKSAPAKEVILKHSKTFDGTLSDSDVMKLAGVSRNTYYKYKKELISELIGENQIDAEIIMEGLDENKNNL